MTRSRRSAPSARPKASTSCAVTSGRRAGRAVSPWRKRCSDCSRRARRGGAFKPLYDERRPIREKIETIAREIYGAAGVAFAPPAERALELLPKLGLGETPVCMAKTQYSFSDDATQLGAPSGFTLHVRDILPAAGAGFVVALAGDIMTMPGLGKAPVAERIRLLPDGTIEGLF